ncbi:MAG: tRNA 4-thiouridine(8) synthase ThiI [Nitrospirae bacterium]|nr:tRNA 4-thiouridine(8) synthase ThiI [Nitrospirota bacterium]
MQILLLKMGELVLKGDNRPFFEKRLMGNVKEALRPLGDWDFEKGDRRLYVSPLDGRVDHLGGAANRARKVFGLMSAVGSHRTGKAWAEMVPASEQIIDDALKGRPEDRVTFKIEARRVDKTFPMRSLEMNRLLGEHLLKTFERLRVDVHDPAICLKVEVRYKGAVVYVDDPNGAGGLPVGTSGRALALISGGIDSPVAIWYGLKRGLEIDAIHFDTPGFTNPQAVEKVKDLCRILSEWGGPRRLHIINFTPLQQLIWASAPPAMRITLMRRMFVRIAEKVCGEIHGKALVTGESLGQVASQTLDSIGVIQSAVSVPILRPLIGFDKSEIIERARKIGTYETSILPYEDCCALFVAKHPETRPVQVEAERVESALPFADPVERAFAERTVVDVRSGGVLEQAESAA